MQKVEQALLVRGFHAQFEFFVLLLRASIRDLDAVHLGMLDTQLVSEANQVVALFAHPQAHLGHALNTTQVDLVKF